MTLNRNPINYFAETEQVMFQPGHIVRGVDFSEDPLLQGRIFSYLDTQLNRHGGPNFEQLPINAPRVPIHNNNRDGAAQNLIHANTHAYSPNSFDELKQATKDQGRGFFTSPTRKVSGSLVRAKANSFENYYSQPRLFFNSLLPAEQQFLINAIRFETSHLTSDIVKKNVLTQLNRIDNSIAVQIAEVLNIPAPAPDPQFYHDNTTIGVSVFKQPLVSITGLKVGYLATKQTASSASSVKESLASDGVTLVVVAETLGEGIDTTYSAADATNFDGVIIASGTADIFSPLTAKNASATLYPAGRPLQILLDSYRYGKPLGFMNSEDQAAIQQAQILTGPGVYTQGSSDGNSTTVVTDIAAAFKEGLRQFKFLDRFPVEKIS
jgi:catalase